MDVKHTGAVGLVDNELGGAQVEADVAVTFRKKVWAGGIDLRVINTQIGDS